jgi:hypothetical protein
MSFLSIRKIFGKRNNHSDELIWIFTQCDRCGEKFRTVIQKKHELTPTYQEEGPAFLFRKELIGASCPNKISLTIKFDKNYNHLSADITGGRFISKQEYDMNRN